MSAGKSPGDTVSPKAEFSHESMTNLASIPVFWICAQKSITLEGSFGHIIVKFFRNSWRRVARRSGSHRAGTSESAHCAKRIMCANLGRQRGDVTGRSISASASVSAADAHAMEMRPAVPRTLFLLCGGPHRDGNQRGHRKAKQQGQGQAVDLRSRLVAAPAFCGTEPHVVAARPAIEQATVA